MAYICEVCAEQFSKEWSLDRHVKHFHKLNFLCNLCGFQTDDKQTSIVHKKQHTQEYFQCEHCNKKLKCRKRLLRHLREQHGTQKFSCTICKYKTNREYQLHAHKKTHIVKQHVSKPQRKKDPKTISSPTQQVIQEDEATSQDSIQGVRSAFRGKIQERSWYIR